MKFRLFTFLFLLITGFCVAQTLSGIVRDDRTNQPLPGVSVRLLSTNRGTVTDQRGYYVLRDLPIGPYTVQLSSVGYRLADQVVEVTRSSTIERDIRLQPTVIQLNQQTVTTSQRSESPDFLRPEVTTVVTARDLRQRAPRTVPEALFGATGVFLQKTNHGGGSPFVRGLTGQQTLLLVEQV